MQVRVCSLFVSQRNRTLVEFKDDLSVDIKYDLLIATKQYA